jgi:ferric-dicitrate binding protein FerR (iron transport regulator)
MKPNAVLALFVVTIFPAVPAMAASPAIGVASAVGAFMIDNSPVNGNVEIVNGAELRTSVAPSDVHLQNGAQIRLATRSTGAVYSDRVQLEQGALRAGRFENYPIHAGQFQIQADAPGTEAIVRVKGKTIEVASIGGTVKITDGGAMLTRVAAGTKMSFQNSAAQATSAQTGAAPAENGPMSDKKAILWCAGVIGVAAIIIGSIAASEGKSPF